ncbi:MAG TPA: hypothetical protein VLE93_02320 [Candidatus Saccharimonadales bacterium]|nr:hypothetical protein [Candidatus Saccharimonadales bacterium]
MRQAKTRLSDSKQSSLLLITASAQLRHTPQAPLPSNEVAPIFLAPKCQIETNPNQAILGRTESSGLSQGYGRSTPSKTERRPTGRFPVKLLRATS